MLENDLDSVELSTTLSSSAEVYRSIIKADTSSEILNRLLREILDFGNSSRILFPVILGLVEELGPEDSIPYIEVLQNVFVRHSIILNLENSRLENRIYSAVRDFRQHKDSELFANSIKADSPTDIQTRTAFETLSLGHNGSRRNILKRLELAKRGTEELDIASPERVHVEHIYPQKPKENEKLANHAQIINRVGNLTLLSARLNQKIKNGSFDEKKSDFENSELILTREVAVFEKWGVDEIEARQKNLAELVPALWPIEQA